MGQRRYGMILYGPSMPTAELSAAGICLPAERLRVHLQTRVFSARRYSESTDSQGENGSLARLLQRATSAFNAGQSKPPDVYGGRRDAPRAPFFEGLLRCGAALVAALLALAELGKLLLRSKFPQKMACVASSSMI